MSVRAEPGPGRRRAAPAALPLHQLVRRRVVWGISATTGLLRQAR
ncbi:hypothetical protein [Kitasatospora sp. NPDC056531]